MSNFVYLISTTFLKEHTPINENVDDKILKNAIQEAQEIYIRDVIGSGIYNELQTQAFAQSVSTANKTLLDSYIAPCLKYYTLTESMLPMTFKMLNKTLGTRTSDNTQPVSIDEMTLIERRYRDKAEYYAQRLREFLQANSTIYPLYFNPGSTIDTIRPHSTQLFGGIYLPPNYEEEYKYYDFPDGESPNKKRN
jgi:hypothetical protein